MKLVPFNPDTLQEAVSILRQGGVIAHPSDTCFGLAGAVMTESVPPRIRAIKGRDEGKPMSVMISVPEQLRIQEYVELDDFSAFVVSKLLPGLVTLLLPKGRSIPPWFLPENPLIGLRMPSHDLTQDLLRAFGGPLITTSANRSGEPPCFRHEEVLQAFEGSEVRPDLVFEGNLTQRTPPSTVVSVEKDFVRIHRTGPLTASHLEDILGVPVRE